MSKATTTEDLIASLAADARPVTPVRWASWLTPWFLVALASIGWLCGRYFGCRADLATLASGPFFWTGIAAWIALAVASAQRAAISALPGRRAGTGSSIAISVALLTLLVRAGMSLAQTGWHTDFSAGIDESGLGCTKILSLLMLLPALVFAWRLRLLAPTAPGRTVAWSLLATGTAAAAGLSFVCGSLSVLHLLIWHVLPIAVFAYVLGEAGRRFWKW